MNVPGCPSIRDAVVEARIKLAARYAALEGGLSASAYTGAVAATIGSAGGASPLTASAAVLSFSADLFATTAAADLSGVGFEVDTLLVDGIVAVQGQRVG